MLLGGYGRVVGVTSFLYGDAFSLRSGGEEASAGRASWRCLRCWRSGSAATSCGFRFTRNGRAVRSPI